MAFVVSGNRSTQIAGAVRTTVSNDQQTSTQTSRTQISTLVPLPDPGAASVPGNAFGTLGTVTVSSFAGAAKGKAAASGALVTVAASTATAAAKGKGAASGSLPTVTRSVLVATAGGRASVGGTFTTVSRTAPDASATGRASTSAALVSVAVSSPAASATGRASVSAPLGFVVSTSIAAAASATGRAGVSGSLPSLAVSLFDANARGRASISGALAAVEVAEVEGSAFIGVPTPADASGDLAEIVVTPLDGSAEGLVSALPLGSGARARFLYQRAAPREAPPAVLAPTLPREVEPDPIVTVPAEARGDFGSGARLSPAEAFAVGHVRVAAHVHARPPLAVWRLEMRNRELARRRKSA